MAKPKLALIPAAQGDKFYSVLPSDGVGDFTFTRASTGTRIAPTGLIEEVPSGDSRLDYDLLNGKVVNCPHYLLEPARTNLFFYSEDFSNSYWTKSGASVSSDVITSPDGSLNADKIVEDTSTSSHNVFRNSSTVTLASHTFSCFVKTNGRNIKLDFFGGNNNAIFNLTSGIVISTNGTGLTAKIEKLLNGWYRCSITQVQTATTIYPNILCVDNSNNSIYQGDGTSGVYIWGAQIELGSYSTSYIPTTTTTITRAAETATGAGNAATFNDSEGVLMAEIAALANDGTNRFISISDGSISNRINIVFDTNNNINARQAPGSVNISTSGINILNSNKIAYEYQSGSQKLWVNGFKIGETNVSTLPSGLDRLNFDSFNGGDDMYCNTREVQYFDSALTDAQLETLTSWTSLQEMITSQLYTNY